MATPAPKSRRHPRPPAAPHLQPLERRLLLNGTLIPAPDHHDLLFDSQRNQLLIVTNHTNVLRYNVSTSALLSPLYAGSLLGGADLSADNNYLYVSETNQAVPNYVIHRLDLNTGAVTDLIYSVGNYPGSAYVNTTTDVASLSHNVILYSSGVDGRTLAFNSQTFINNPDYALTNMYDSSGSLSPIVIARSANDSIAVSLAPKPDTDSPYPAKLSRYSALTDSHTYNLIADVFAGAAVATNADGSLIAVGNPNHANVYDANVNLAFTLPVSGGLAFDPAQSLLFVADPVSNNIIAYNTNTHAEAFRIPIGEKLGPTNNYGNGVMTLNADGSLLFLATPSGVREYRLTGPTTAAFSSLPATQTPGAPTPFSLTIHNLDGSIAANYTGTIHFSSSDPLATLPPDYTFTPTDAGTHTFSFTPQTPTTTTLAVTDAALPGFSGTASLIVAKLSPTLSLEASSTGNLGDPATITAVLTSPSSNPSSFPLTGTVTFYDGATLLSAAPVNGRFVSITSQLPGGPNIITATYSGNTNFNPATSTTPLPLPLSPVDTQTTFTLSVPFPSDPYGVILKATVTTNRGTGLLQGSHVTFYDGPNIVGAATLSSGTATFVPGLLTPGNHSFRALFNATPSFNASSSNTIPDSLPSGALSPIFTVTSSSPSTSLYYPTTYTVHAAPVGPIPTGAITFYDGLLPLVTLPLAHLPLTYSFRFSTSGTHLITVHYSGDLYNAPIISAPFQQIVAPATVIDLLALYSTDALALLGSQQNLLDSITRAVDQTNNAMVNSQIPVVIHLVHIQAVNYSTSYDLATDLAHLTNPTDGVLDNVPALRNQYAADLVALFVQTDLDANEIGLGQVLLNPKGDPDTAYSVVSANPDASNDDTLAHEIGHNLGAEHDVADSTGPGVFPYSHGYTFYVNGNIDRDIMSYVGTLTPYYANPNVLYNGVPTGDPATADLARTFIQTAPLVANYRSATDVNLVTRTYQNLLNRNPDDAGLAYWVNELSTNSFTPAAFTTALLESAEYRTDQIQSSYQSILHRPADAGGLAYWTHQLALGTPLATIFTSLYASPEYTALHPANPAHQTTTTPPAALITSLYTDILSRPVDPAGLTYWTTQLGLGQSVSQIASSLLHSAEYIAAAIDEDYLTYLHRHATSAESAADAKYFSPNANPATLLQSLFASHEYLTQQ